MEYLDNPVNIAVFALLVFLFVQKRSKVRKALETQLRMKDELEKKLKKRYHGWKRRWKSLKKLLTKLPRNNRLKIAYHQENYGKIGPLADRVWAGLAASDLFFACVMNPTRHILIINSDSTYFCTALFCNNECVLRTGMEHFGNQLIFRARLKHVYD